MDGYTVTLDGDLTAGADAKLTLSVSRDGKPVTDLQPYLAAYGHLVALRDGDLAYLHVHPEGRPTMAAPSRDRTSCSTPPCPVPASTTSSWTSSTGAWSEPPSSPSPQPGRTDEFR